MTTATVNPAPSAEPAADPPVAEITAELRENTYVVIAAYNEAGVIGDVVAELAERFPKVIVVDDGSYDGTAEQARPHAAYVLRHMVNRGQGAALQTGIEFALRQGAEYVITFDADGQHCVDDIPRLLEPLASGRAEIALGSRFLGEAVDMRASRRIVLRLAVLFTRWVNRVRLTDAHNGLRGFTRKAAERIRITADRMAHASELIDIIKTMDLPYAEVPVRIRYTDYSRRKGQSVMSSYKIMVHYFVGRLFE